MQTVFRNRKPISLFVLVSLYWLCIPQLPAQGAMVATEYTLHRDSIADFNRVRIKAFVSRKDVIAQLQSYGISSEEALVRVDSLTDQEVALIAGKLDQLPAPAGAYNSEAYLVAFWPIFLIAAGIVIIIALILSVGDAVSDAVSDRNFPEKT